MLENPDCSKFREDISDAHCGKNKHQKADGIAKNNRDFSMVSATIPAFSVVDMDKKYKQIFYLGGIDQLSSCRDSFETF